ncbi:hypothetical protein WJX72_000506 [[Myrmecia] bisecta]|uniref:Uncharacterized protein n=1 Tax=[Myrmecia] bisecta TaxID=41462 RepID=A0AAW1PTF9_9CHLO
MSSGAVSEFVEDSDSDDDGANEYYAGGEKSGQVVRGAPKSKDEAADRVAGLFEKARQAGATQGTAEDLQAPKPQSGAFSGTARTLAGDAPVAPAQALAPASQPVVHTITFYNNGIFVVDNGEPRHVHDPANLPFMMSIQKGECPAELEPESPGTPINVNLVRKDDEYKPPAKPRYAAFSGPGHSLTGGASSSSSVAASSSVPPGTSDDVKWEGVKESEPTTSIQLRLNDGSRLVVRFNLSHTVGDVRRFIQASRPDMRSGYALMTAFPSAQLTDDSQTIGAAGLSNAVIIQK